MNFVTEGQHHSLMTMAALVVVIAGIQAAAPILVPMLLSAFISIICWPLVEWLYRHKVPAWLAILMVVTGLLVLMTMVGLFVGKSIDSFIGNLPQYQSRLQENMSGLFIFLTERGFDLSQERFDEFLNAGRLMQWAGTLLTALTGAFANTALIIFYVTFMFLEAFLLPTKLRLVYGDSNLAVRFELFFANLRRYLRLKTLMSLLTGGAVTLWLTFLKVDYPILWGALAFVLNFIPNIGSFIAAVPAILLALVQFGLQESFYTGLGYLVINTLIGGILDPRIVGIGLGLSTLVVFLSLIFWGWILGPVGMFLSVPLTVIFKMFLEDNPATRWMAVLLGDVREVSATRDE